jgi:hypothetical protein
VPTETEASAFRYPSQPLSRRHGPRGYTHVQSFRPWLRDDFSFRCVYCLIREQWGRVTGEFDLDHFAPQRRNQEQAVEYENLLFACHACNLRKGDHLLPDPAAALTIEQVRIYPDGTLVGLTDDADRIIRLLCLNSPAMTRWRRSWIRIIELVEERDPELFRELMGYPDDLPNLRRCRVPENTRPEGIKDSCFARRERGELPDVYLE